MYSMKRQRMNNNDSFLTPGKLWAVWDVKQDNPGSCWPRVNYFKCEKPLS